MLVILPAEELSSLPVGNELNQANIDQLTVAGVHAAATAAGSTDPVTRREAWTALAELWLQPAIEKSGGLVGVGDLDIEVLNDEELTFARSRNAPELDLAYLTSRAA